MSFILVSYFWELSSADSWLAIITSVFVKLHPEVFHLPSCLFEDASLWLSAPPPHARGIFFSLLDNDMLVEILELKLLDTWPLGLALLSPSINHTRLGWAYSTAVRVQGSSTHLCCWGSVTWYVTPLLCLSKTACWFPGLAVFLCGWRSAPFQIPYIQGQKPWASLWKV